MRAAICILATVIPTSLAQAQEPPSATPQRFPLNVWERALLSKYGTHLQTPGTERGVVSARMTLAGKAALPLTITKELPDKLALSGLALGKMLAFAGRGTVPRGAVSEMEMDLLGETIMVSPGQPRYNATGGSVCATNGYLAAMGPMKAQFTGKERDGESGLDYFGARYMSSVQGRFTSPDPTFLNILKVVNPQRWNLYGYAVNNPLRNVDPDGEESIAIDYPGYQVGVHGNFSLPLGHAGVVVVDNDGATHYFEYGRYKGPTGDVRNAGPDNVATPNLQRDASGKFTPESMKNLLGTLSHASGKNGEVDALVFDTRGPEDAAIKACLEAREKQSSDPNRQHYSLFGGHNCGTLICEAFDAAGHRAPSSLSRVGNTPGQVFDFLRLLSGPSQDFQFTPQKEKVTSKICFNDEMGKKHCQ